MIRKMLEILRRLLLSDTEVITKATAELNACFTLDDLVRTLWDICTSSVESHVRHLAVVLLTRRLGDASVFKKLDKGLQLRLNFEIFDTMTLEKDEVMLIALARLTGIVFRENCTKTDWIKMKLKYLYALLYSKQQEDLEKGATIFCSMADTHAAPFVANLTVLTSLLEAPDRFKDSLFLNNVLNGISFIVPHVRYNASAQESLKEAIPLIFKALLVTAHGHNQVHFNMDVLSNIVDYVPHLLRLHFKEIFSKCIELSASVHLHNKVRTQSIQFLGTLLFTEYDTKVIRSQLEMLLYVIFDMMADQSFKDDTHYPSAESGLSLGSSASETLRLFALVFSPTEVLTRLEPILLSALQMENPHNRVVTFDCLRVVTESCSEILRSQFLPQMLTIVIRGVNDESELVRNAALYTLGEFCEHLQPTLTLYADRLFGFLIALLHSLWETANKETEIVVLLMVILRSYCKHLRYGIINYLSEIIEVFTRFIDSSLAKAIVEESMSCLAVTVAAAGDRIVDCLPRMVSSLKPFMVTEVNNDNRLLCIQAMELMVAFISSIDDKSRFTPFEKDTFSFCLKLISKSQDSVILSTAFKLVNSLAYVLKSQRVYMTEMVSFLFISIKLDPNWGGQDADAKESEILGAIHTLLKIMEECASTFHKFFQSAYDTLTNVMFHPSIAIRMASIKAVGVLINVMIKENLKVRPIIIEAMPVLLNIFHNDKSDELVKLTMTIVTQLMEELEKDPRSEDKIYKDLFSNSKKLKSKHIFDFMEVVDAD